MTHIGVVLLQIWGHLAFTRKMFPEFAVRKGTFLIAVLSHTNSRLFGQLFQNDLNPVAWYMYEQTENGKICNVILLQIIGIGCICKK